MGLTWQLSGKEPACQMRVQSLSWEDPLEEEMATHSSIFESHGQKSLVGYSL